jgi:hypothetical protein
MKTEEDFNKLSMQDLLEEIILYTQGDGWDGMSSRYFYQEGQIALRTFEKRLKELEEKAWMYDSLK